MFHAVPSFSNPKSALRKVADEHEPGSVAGVVNAVAHVPSSDLELDHSMAMLCRLRDGPGACGAVYATQAAYNASHARMAAAALAADAAFGGARGGAGGVRRVQRTRPRDGDRGARRDPRLPRARDRGCVRPARGAAAGDAPGAPERRRERRQVRPRGRRRRRRRARRRGGLRENALPRAGKVVGIERRVVTQDDQHDSKSKRRRSKRTIPRFRSRPGTSSPRRTSPSAPRRLPSWTP